MSNSVKVNCALFSAVILWSTAFVAIRMGLEGYAPATVGFIRFAVASLILAVPLFKTGFPRLSRRQMGELLLIGVVGTALYSILLNSGEQTITPGMASFLIAQTPIMNACLAMLFLGERPSFNTIIAITISCAGVTFIVFGQPVATSFNLGLILVLIATVCGSIQSILQKHMLAKLSALHVTCLSTWWATIALGLCSLNVLEEIRHAPLSATWAVVFLGIVPSSLGQWLWNYGLSKSLVAKASAYLYLMPFLSTFFAWLILGESPSFFELLGGSIALCGVIFLNKDVLRALRPSLPPSIGTSAR